MSAHVRSQQRSSSRCDLLLVDTVSLIDWEEVRDEGRYVLAVREQGEGNSDLQLG